MFTDSTEWQKSQVTPSWAKMAARGSPGARRNRIGLWHCSQASVFPGVLLRIRS